MEHRAAVAVALAGLASTGCASDTAPEPPASSLMAARSYDCRRAAGPIVIDGRVDDAAWARAPWSEPFVDIEGPGHPTPRYETRMKMLWDDTYLYVAAKLEEPHVWGELTEHDAVVYYDNDFEIFIDPDGDRREYYEIEVNALGTIFDLFLDKTYDEGGNADHDWSMTGMVHAVFVDGTLNDPSDIDTGWSVEFALPWTTLGEFANCPSPPDPGDWWRVNYSRVQWQHTVEPGGYVKVPDTPENNWVWSPQGLINMHKPAFWGHVRFIAGDESGAGD